MFNIASDEKSTYKIQPAFTCLQHIYFEYVLKTLFSTWCPGLFVFWYSAVPIACCDVYFCFRGEIHPNNLACLHLSAALRQKPDRLLQKSRSTAITYNTNPLELIYSHLITDKDKDSCAAYTYLKWYRNTPIYRTKFSVQYMFIFFTVIELCTGRVDDKNKA